MRNSGAIRCSIGNASANVSSCSASRESGSATATTSAAPISRGAKARSTTTSAATRYAASAGDFGSSPIGAVGRPNDSATTGISADSSIRLTSKRLVTKSPP